MEFEPENASSHILRSLRPNPFWYVARWSNWQRQWWAWPWKASSSDVWLREGARGPRQLCWIVDSNWQPVSYLLPWFGPKVLSFFSVTANAYLNLLKYQQVLQIKSTKTHCSPLCTISAMIRVKQWQQNPMNTPASSKIPHILLVISCFMLFQCSMQALYPDSYQIC